MAEIGAVYIECIHLAIRDEKYKNIFLHKKYLLVEITDSFYRIVNDKHEPILYPKKWFGEILGDVSRWIRSNFSDGEYSICPEVFSSRYFFEDYFDKQEYARNRFDEYLKCIDLRRGYNPE